MLSQVKFIMIGGPTGIGKTSLIDHLLTVSSYLYKPKTYTTRSPRPNDQPGMFEYLSHDAFGRLTEEDYFVQVDEVLGNLYGMAVNDFSNAPLNRSTPIKEIHHKDHLKFKQLFPHAISVLIIPTDWTTYRLRIAENAQLEGSRKGRADEEIAYHSLLKPSQQVADLVVINDWQKPITEIADHLLLALQSRA